MFNKYLWPNYPVKVDQQRRKQQLTFGMFSVSCGVNVETEIVEYPSKYTVLMEKKNKKN